MHIIIDTEKIEWIYLGECPGKIIDIALIIIIISILGKWQQPESLSIDVNEEGNDKKRKSVNYIQ